MHMPDFKWNLNPNLNLNLAWQFFRLEKGHLHQRYQRWTQTILMVFLISLSQTSHNIQRFLADNLAGLLGADLVLTQQTPLSDKQLSRLGELSETIVSTRIVNTTLVHKGQWQNTRIKAVGEGYPLQGQLRVKPVNDAHSGVLRRGPERGEIWPDARLMAALALNPGDMIMLANLSLKVSAVLEHEPDRLMEGHDVQMRALINLDDLAASDIPADTVDHRYLIGADKTQAQAIIHWQRDTLPGAQLLHKEGRHPLALFWQRTENLIGLASVLLFFMAAIAIQQLSRTGIEKEQHFCAVCQSVGISRASAMGVSAMKWLFALLAQLPTVLIVSALCHWVLIIWLSDTFSQLTWHWDMLLALQYFGACLLLFMMFYLPVQVALMQSSVAQLMRHQYNRTNKWLQGGCTLLVISAVAVWFSDNILLTSMLLGAMAVCIVLIMVLSWLVLTTGEKLTQHLSGLLPFTLYMMKQRLLTKSTQILGTGLCAFLLLFTLMLLHDLGNTMKVYQRQHDGNLLVSQATAAQMTDLEQWARQHGAGIRQSKPYLYARVVKINGGDMEEFAGQPSGSLATLQKSIRLHWTKEMPLNNRLVQGQWWNPNDDNWQQVSVEQEVMTDLGLSVGDRLSLYIGEQETEFTIVASHEVVPGKGAITFWVQMPEQALAHLSAPSFSMASLELQPQHFPLLGELWQRHPTLRMVSLQEMTQRFDRILAMITQVITGFAAVIILLAIVVILASVHAAETQEKKKHGIILSFGFTRAICLKLTMIDWLVTGAIAAGGAIAGTWIAGVLIYQSQFALTYQPDFVWLTGTLVIILTGVAVTGITASKHSLSANVRQLMAE